MNNGFVPTPAATVDLMVERLFASGSPRRGARLLDPGCGEGEFIDGVIRWCDAHRSAVPHIVGVEQDPQRARFAKERFRANASIEIVCKDFLGFHAERFDYVIGNPPYVSLGHLTDSQRADYRAEFETASGRFDLYMLFFEQSLRLLAPTGRLVFITPEKFTYVGAARPLRGLLLRNGIEELQFLDERTFPDHVTYPLVTTVMRASSHGATTVIRRSGDRTEVTLNSVESWMPVINGSKHRTTGPTLSDICIRVSCGVATGADALFVKQTSTIPSDLARFARPTIAGRQLIEGRAPRPSASMLIPYAQDGTLLSERRLGALGEYLRQPANRRQLRARVCAARKEWYAFHDSMPLSDMLMPKILCKDISPRPFFVTDTTGTVIPRHSVYYIVPENSKDLKPLCEYLNSEFARDWITAHAQRAANGYVRLQSHVLKRLPVPESFAEASGGKRGRPLDETPLFAAS